MGTSCQRLPLIFSNQRMTTPPEHVGEFRGPVVPRTDEQVSDRLDAEFALSERDILEALQDLRQTDHAFLYRRGKARSDAALGGCLVVFVVIGSGLVASVFLSVRVVPSAVGWYFLAVGPLSGVLIAFHCWRRVKAVSPAALAASDRERVLAIQDKLRQGSLRCSFDARGVTIQLSDAAAKHIPGEAIRRTQSLPSGTVFFDASDQLLLVLPSRAVPNADVQAFLDRHAVGFPHALRGDDAWLINHFRDRHVPCPQCGYDLRNLGTTRCPECGAVLTRQAIDPNHPSP
ncbi:MAG: hypothetical protein K2X32_09830 [Phycisphaerales bacterium]|nr:hypothetical protein [Phycisphaerales bacterium]